MFKDNNVVVIKSFYLFMIVLYVPGLIFFPFFEEAYQYYFNYSSSPYLPFFLSLIFFSIPFLLFFYFSEKITRTRLFFFSPNTVAYFIVITAMIYFIASFIFSLNYSSSFRHVSRFSDAGPSATLVFMLKPFCDFILLLSIIHVVNGEVLGPKVKISLMLIFLGSALSLNSSLAVLFFPLVLGALFYRKIFIIPLFSSLRRILLLFIFAPLAVFSILLIGIGNKIGYDVFLSEISVSYFVNMMGELATRVSTSLFSVTMLWDNYIQGFLSAMNLGHDSGESLIHTASNRMSLVIGGGFDRDLIATVDRMNYLNLFKDYHPRAGASPGVLASMFYFPIFPLGLVFVPLFYVLVLRSVAIHIDDRLKYNSIYLFSIFYLTLGLFESPLNVFMLLDPLLVLLVFVMIFSEFVNVKKTFSL